MSGHSKWASIKHQKGIADARRGKLFTKLTREIIVAVREGGGNPETNFRLRLAVQKARDNSMPLDNIERAIKKGSGSMEGESMVELALVGYGPGGAAIMVQALTDNRNRTIQGVRNIFTKGGGSLGENGCVAWIFDLKGYITVKTEDTDADEIAMKAIDAGADDVNTGEGYIEIYTSPEHLEGVRESLESDNIVVASAEQSMVPRNTVELDEKMALQTLKMLDKLEEIDEVQQVYSNADFSETVLEKYQS